MKYLNATILWFKITVTLFIVLLFSCTEKPSNTISIGILDGPSAVSFIQLIDKPVEINGKKIEIIIKNEPQQIQALMMQGKLDFAILPTVMAANLYNKGVKYRMVSCPIWGTLYLVSNTSIYDINDIKDQTISVFGQGSTSDILVRRLIQQKMLTGVKIDYTHLTNNEIAQALLLKKTKLAVVSEPLVSTLLSKDSSIHVVSKIDCIDYFDNSDKNIFVQTAFMVSEKFTIENPSLIKPVCEAYTNSCNFINEQPEMAARLLVEHHFSSNIELANKSLPLCNIHYVGAFALQHELTRYLTVFYEFNPKSVGDHLPDSEFIYQYY